MEAARYLHKDQLAPALAFINSPLWQEMKRAALERRPPAASPSEPPHEAAARGFQRDAWEKAFTEMEKLPRDVPETPDDPFARPAVQNTRD